jgi:hypothetical protein
LVHGLRVHSLLSTRVEASGIGLLD